MAIEYKCENCAASLRFDVDKNMLVCDYCGSEFSVDYAEEKMDKKQEEETLNKAADEENWKENYDSVGEEQVVKMQFKQRTCPSCGGILLGDENSAATFCAYCGNATLTEAVMTDVRVPDYIIPFKNTKDAAQKAFLDWGKKGFVTPKDFTSKSTIEKITGLYVPFYLYTCVSDCDYAAKGRKIYIRGNYEITEHYDVRRNITVKYKDIPVDASEKMIDETMDMLEPFDFNELEEFKKAYMSGFFADKYSYTDKELVERIAKRVIDYTKDAAKETISGAGYNEQTPNGSKVDITWNKTKYCMLPVWILNYNYKGQNYEFAMNGQTGRVVGKRPVSGWRTFLYFILWFVPSFLIITIISLFIAFAVAPVIGLIGGVLIALFAMFCSLKEQKTEMAAKASNYKVGKTKINSQIDRFIKKTKRLLDND